MAGHRRSADPARAKRAASRAANWRDRIAKAATSEDFYDAASDWLRAAAGHVGDPDRRTQILNDAADYLAGHADELEREAAGARPANVG